MAIIPCTSIGRVTGIGSLSLTEDGLLPLLASARLNERAARRLASRRQTPFGLRSYPSAAVCHRCSALWADPEVLQGGRHGKAGLAGSGVCGLMPVLVGWLSANTGCIELHEAVGLDRCDQITVIADGWERTIQFV